MTVFSPIGAHDAYRGLRRWLWQDTQQPGLGSPYPCTRWAVLIRTIFPKTCLMRCLVIRKEEAPPFDGSEPESRGVLARQTTHGQI